MGESMTGVEPQLSVRRGREAVAFYEAAFGARIRFRPGGTADYRERDCTLQDPAGHRWQLAEAIADAPPGPHGPHRPRSALGD